MQLRQPEPRLAKKLRCRMHLLVPGGVLVRVLETEVRAHVDDARACGQPGGRLARANVVREAAQEDAQAVWLRLAQERAVKVEEREDRPIGLAGKRSGGELAELDRGMPCQKMHKRHPGIAVCPGYSGLESLTHGRMSIHWSA